MGSTDLTTAQATHTHNMHKFYWGSRRYEGYEERGEHYEFVLATSEDILEQARDYKSFCKTLETASS